ncbi:MAG: type II secretion system protein [Patescibacteria group bacterium]|nr:type II secretion system protein [Patescibacteria group bacterium]
MRQVKNRKFLTGFTLIELLVVIAVIGLLATIVMVSLNSARKKARDAERKSDLKQISLALEMYYDKYNGYPNDTFNGWESPCNTTTNDIGKLVTEGFIPKISCDPLNSTTNRYYFDPDGTCSGGYCSNYCFYTTLETTGNNYGIQNGGYTTCPGI